MTVRFEVDSEAAAHRVEAWCGEPLLHEGEDIAVALASGTVRRQALEAALAEMERGLPEPSFEWRRDYSLVLGLERVLAEPQPRLASGTTLRRHQVDALAGQLAALISDLERDRKSTRLNSSHSSISYAVFCLKTKNTEAVAASWWGPISARSFTRAPRVSRDTKISEMPTWRATYGWLRPPKYCSSTIRRSRAD